MVKKAAEPTYTRLTAETDEVLAKLAIVKRNVEKAQGALTEARVKADRAESLHRRSRSMAVAARRADAEARRRAEEARRKSEQAQRRGLSRLRWDTDAKRWLAEGRRSEREIVRWDDAARHHDRVIKGLESDVRARMEVVKAVVSEEHSLAQRYKYLSGQPGRAGASDQAEPQLPQSLNVTERANAAIQ